MSMSVHFCESLCATVISGQYHFSRLSVWIVILKSPFSVTGKDDNRTSCRYALTHTFCISPSVSVEPPCLDASYILSGQVFSIRWQYVHGTVSVESPHNLPSDVWGVLFMLCLTEFVLKACSCAARIKPSVPYFNKTFLSHLAATLCFFSGSHAGFSLLLDTLLNSKLPSSPSFLSRYILPTLLLVCRQPLIANIFLVFLSMLNSSSATQSAITAL